MRTIARPKNRTRSLAVAAALTLALSSAACSSGDDASSEDSSSAAPSGDPEATTSLVGPGCADYAKANPSGAGSVEGMSKAPLATAAAANPLLKTLTKAVSGELNSRVDLVDTLNGDQFTVFAPVDDAFAKLPSDTLKALSTPEGAATLKDVLTYHVVPGQIAPDDIDGRHKTVEGKTVEVAGEGDDISINDGQANVLCGGVKTANATVYLIDSVLMPPSE